MQYTPLSGHSGHNGSSHHGSHNGESGGPSISARSLRSQRISPSGYVVKGCDFSERKDTSHVARALSFDRKPSVRSFNLGAIPPPTKEHIKHARKSHLNRKNAVKLGPIEYVRYVFRRMRMRMRLRRRSAVTFQHSALNFTRKRSYLLNSTSSSYQYRIKTRDLFKRRPKVSQHGISSPFNVLRGEEALLAAEMGKKQTFNLKTQKRSIGAISLPGGRKELPKRASVRPQNTEPRRPSTKASLILPNPPDVGKPSPEGQQDSETEYDDLPDLVPSTSNYGRRDTRRASLIQPEVRMYEEDPVDIEDALDFVNAWGSYLQRAVASRMIKDRNAKLQELDDESRYINYEESDDSSAYSEEHHGVYDSCTSECFAPNSDWNSTSTSASDDDEDDGSASHERTASTIRPGNTANRPAPPSSALPAIPSHQHQQARQAPADNPLPTRRVSGPRPMRTRHLSLNERKITPLQIHTRGYSTQTTPSQSSESPNRTTPPITVRRSRVTLGQPRQITTRHSMGPLNTPSDNFDFGPHAAEPSLRSSWVEKFNTASPNSKASSKKLERQNAVLYENLTPSHSARSSRVSASSSSSASESGQLLGTSSYPNDPMISVWSLSSETN